MFRLSGETLMFIFTFGKDFAILDKENLPMQNIKIQDECIQPAKEM